MAGNFEKDRLEALELFTEILVDQKRSPEIISTCCAEIYRFYSWWAERGNGVYGSRRVTRQDVKYYLQDLNQLIQPAACNLALAALRAFFAFWMYEGPENNPTRNIANAWDDLKANSWLDEDYQRQLESAVDQQLRMPLETSSWQINWVRAAALVRFLLHTGMHTEEARLLFLSDLDLSKPLGTARVRGKRERSVQLDGPTCAALRAWLAVRQNSNTDWVWLEVFQGKDQALGRRSVWRACVRMADLAHLNPRAISPRILRNTCAHNLLASGLSPNLVKHQLRFKSVEITLRYQ